MKQSLIALPRLLIAFFSCLIGDTPLFAEPANLSLVQKEIRTYYDSGLYEQELAQTINKARQFILEQAKTNQANQKQQKLALVLDIDETSISNYQKMVKRNFQADQQQIHAEILKANSPAIKPMLSLYKDALKHGIQVFFVTGRNESERRATQLNLTKAGYSNWSGLYLRPQNYSEKSIIPFKSQTRALIAKQGYTIVASIGDQYSDIKGGYAEKGFKLPNPFYYLP
ncbi:MAG TPA: HAD family acid phosphatase [Legionella sp.]|nr:HAD family acid phosphatase [Legionella sp.]